MLRQHLLKNWREIRASLLMVCVVLAVIPLTLAWVFPTSMSVRLPWCPIATLVGAVLLGAELITGEARRGQLDYLARLPGALRTAFVAKLITLATGIAILGGLGYCVEIGAARIVSGPIMNLWPTATTDLVVWSFALAIWILATTCWMRTGPTAVGLTLLVPATLLAPIASFSVGHLGIDPLPFELRPAGIYALCVGLVLFWIGTRQRLAQPRERGRWGGYATVVVAAFVPVWAMGAHTIYRWHRVDPDSLGCRITHSFLGSGGQHAFLNMRQEWRDGTGPEFSTRVDLDTGEWEQVGGAQSYWIAPSKVIPGVHPGITPRPLDLLERATCAPDGRSGPFTHELVETRTSAVLAQASTSNFTNVARARIREAARSASPYRTPDGARVFLFEDTLWLERSDEQLEQLPWRPGDIPHYATGYGFRIVNHVEEGLTDRYFDLTRLQTFEVAPKCSPTIRSGAWLISVPHKPERLLFWPESGAIAPIRGLREGERIGPLIDEVRVIVYRPGDSSMTALDPESGDRVALHAAESEGRRIMSVNEPNGMDLVTTPSGATIVLLRLGDYGNCFAKLEGTELICTPYQESRYPRLLTCLDDETVIVTHNQRTIERHSFGKPGRLQIFPPLVD